jgi:hypothetical protein
MRDPCEDPRETVSGNVTTHLRTLGADEHPDGSVQQRSSTGLAMASRDEQDGATGMCWLADAMRVR